MSTSKSVQYLHFTIGEELGIRLMEIAHEHLIYGNDPVKALRTITDSLIGCPNDMALKILIGDIVLFVDVEAQNIMPTERIPELHDAIFPKIDVVQYIRKCDKNIEKHANSIINDWNVIKAYITKRQFKINVDFNYEDVFKFIAGNDKVILDTLRELAEVDEITGLIAVTKNFIEHSTKLQNTLEWMYKTFNEFDKVGPYVDYVEIKQNISSHLLWVMQKMQEVMNMDYTMQPDDNELDNYLKSVKAIEETLTFGIAPVDIFKNYSAGWLSPTGEFYGLNGEIANMLHNQIADALQDIGVIPIYETKEDEQYFFKEAKDKIDAPKVNPDSWLEEKGWVKIHGDSINYAGCLNDKHGKTNVNMTDIQIDIIVKYINLCHRGMMKLGWKREPVSAARFGMFANANMSHINKTYFNFD